MEKRILTNSFNLRFATTMHGLVVVNAFFALQTFVSDVADFKPEMSKLAYRLMHNHFLDGAAPPSPTGPPPASRASSGTASPEGCQHVLVPLRSVPGVHKAKKGSKQERCAMCNKHTSWVCALCTTGANALVPLCPETSRSRKKPGTVTHHACLEKHRANPAVFPKGKRAKAKRKRSAVDEEDDPPLEDDDEDDEEEDED